MTTAGIGWRHPHYGELLAMRRSPGPSAPAFLEVHSENFFGEGGAALAVLSQARETWPVSLHGVGLALGSAQGVDPWHLDRLAALVRRIEPMHVSDHACFARATVAGMPAHACDLLPVPFHREALDVMCANVQHVQDRLGRTILVENLSAYVGCAGSEWDEAEFLSRLAARTGCGLLVDVNNIYVNALNDRIAGAEGDPAARCIEWLDRLPQGIVGELHVAGHCHVNDEHGEIVIDDHGSRVCAQVWSLLRHAARRFPGAHVLVEWDTGVPPLAVLLDELGRARECMQAREPQEEFS